jgi:hypothetical protein
MGERGRESRSRQKDWLKKMYRIRLLGSTVCMCVDVFVCVCVLNICVCVCVCVCVKYSADHIRRKQLSRKIGYLEITLTVPI